MRILLINPNTSVSITDRLMASASTATSADTELVPVTAHRGVPYIASRIEAAIASNVVMELLAEHSDGIDGAIIAAFGDPGLGAARELMDYPVVGLAETGMLTACMVGKRFSIVSFARVLAPWYRETVEWHQLVDRLASIRMPDTDFSNINDVQTEMQTTLVALAQSAVTEDQADVIVFGGAPLSGLVKEVMNDIPVPVIDCAAAAVMQLETLIRLKLRRPIAGTFRRPPAKPSTGLPPELARRIGHQDN
jgi:Asp/Glu/hydantoin racemase